ncbi:hypothetical protein [uncultured Roseibium sp.]|uniref:hypothetical protein n=1 Tax=uncultured Roseibium sp. TaxID=1936171 RepID=UPI003217D802
MIDRKKYDITDMVHRAKGLGDGPVLPEEVEYARNLLRERSGDAYGALYVVGLCGKPADAPLIERYLHGSENDVHVEVALKALCRFLGLIDQYRPLIRSLILDPPDEISPRRMTAIHLAEEYFVGFDDDELGCKLVRILCDFEDSCRSSARDALAVILEFKSDLDDPYGLDFADWDEDSTRIVEAACRKFKCPKPELMNMPGRH